VETVSRSFPLPRILRFIAEEIADIMMCPLRTEVVQAKAGAGSATLSMAYGTFIMRLFLERMRTRLRLTSLNLLLYPPLSSLSRYPPPQQTSHSARFARASQPEPCSPTRSSEV
jgi:hypothetical protein